VIDPFLCIRGPTAHAQLSAFPPDKHSEVGVAMSKTFAQKARSSLPLPARGSQAAAQRTQYASSPHYPGCYSNATASV
jgi:hypothetical protein